MTHKHGTAIRPHKLPLPAAHAAKLRQLVAEHNTKAIARMLGCGEATVVELATGGYVRPVTLERVVRALEEVAA